MSLYTLLFTDIEGSTRLAQGLGQGWPDLRARHHAICRAAFMAGGGEELDEAGDGFVVAFTEPAAALRSVVDIQKAFARQDWEGPPVRVRAGIHTGDIAQSSGGWVGLALHETSRIAGAANGGQIVVSNITAELLAGVMIPGVRLRDVGLHRLRDLAQPMRLFQVEIEDVEPDARPLRTIDAPRHNLPPELTSFVGRDDDVARVIKRVRDERVVTLVGPGGVGKSRLALRAGGQLIDGYAGGVWLVELAPVGSDELVEGAVATAVGVRSDPLRPLGDVLAERLTRGPSLLIFDNCEHVLAGAARSVSDLVGRCPELHVLATSIEPLRLRAEVVERIESLPVDAADGSSGSLLGVEVPGPAVRLFADRALAVDPTFALDPDTTPVVNELCRQLDGLPLAIELAAARAATLTPVQLLDRLADRFALLSSGSREAHTRHRTLRAVIDWAVDLLMPSERALLERMCVFRGGCTLESAEAVLSGGFVDPGDVVDVLSGLVDRSLVIVAGGGRHRRYRLLEAVRAYGQDRLGEAGTLDAARDRHLSWVEALAAAAARLSGAEQSEWFDRCEAELDNIRAALDWSVSTEERAGRGLTIASQLLNFWMARGLRHEAVARVEQLVRLAPVSPRDRVNAVFGVGLLAVMSQPVAGERLARIASDLARDDPVAQSTADVLWAFVHGFRGRPAEALAALARAQDGAAAALEDDETVGVWVMLSNGLVAMVDNCEYTVERFDRARERLLAAGDTHMAGGVGSLQACAFLALGRAEEATAVLRESLDIADTVRCPSCRSQALSIASRLPGRDYVECRAELVEALGLADSIDETLTRLLTFEALVSLERAEGRFERVATLSGAVDALRRRSGSGLYAAGVTDAARGAALEAEAQLGEAAYLRLKEAGERMTYSEMLDVVATAVTRRP